MLDYKDIIIKHYALHMSGRQIAAAIVLLPPSFVQNQPATIVRQWPDILSTGKLPADSVFSFIVH